MDAASERLAGDAAAAGSKTVCAHMANIAPPARPPNSTRRRDEYLITACIACPPRCALLSGARTRQGGRASPSLILVLMREQEC